MPTKTIDPSMVSYFATIENIARKFENDLIASGRFRYVRTDGNRKIYAEITTGREVPVIVPQLSSPTTAK